MADNKKSFVLYTDQIGIFNKLTDEQAGALIKHIFSYVNDQDPEGDFITELAFESIKQQLKRDLKKYETRADRSRENGKKGGRPKNPTEPKKPSGLISNLDEPRKPDNDNVTVSVTVNDTVNVNDIKTKVYSQAIQDSYKRILVNFPTQLQPKNKKTQNEWLDTLEKLERIDKIPLQEVEKIVKATRQDDFWAKNFMSLTKLRKKNPDNLPYIVVFNEKINKNGQNGNTETRTPNERAREIFNKRRQQQNNAS